MSTVTQTPASVSGWLRRHRASDGQQLQAQAKETLGPMQTVTWRMTADNAVLHAPALHNRGMKTHELARAIEYAVAALIVGGSLVYGIISAVIRLAQYFVG